MHKIFQVVTNDLIKALFSVYTVVILDIVYL